MSELSIRELISLCHDSNVVNLETIVLGDETMKKLRVSWGSTIHKDPTCSPLMRDDLLL